MSNQLFTTEFLMRELEPQINFMLAQARKEEAAIAEFLKAHPGATPDDVVAEWGPWPRALKRYRLKTADERWCEWQSDNHGWGLSGTE